MMASGSRRSDQRGAIAVVFVVHGLVFASWTAHIPHVKAALGLTDHQLGLALLGAPIGAVASAATLVWLLPKADARRLLPIALVGYALGGLLVGVASNSLGLFGALAVWGYFQGGLDATMNTEAVAIEAALDRPMMSGLHALWSAGSLAGAALGTACAAAGLGLGAQLAVLAAVVLVATPAVVSGLPAGSAVTPMPPPVPESGNAPEYLHETAAPSSCPEPRQHTRRISRGVVALGVICTADLLCEGAVADWSAVYLRDNLQSSAIVSGLGYAMFMTGMLAIRAVGDRLRRRVAPKTSVIALAGLATVGMAAGLALGDPAASLIGFLCLGIGLGSVFPMAVSAAGRLPGVDAGVAVAIVSACGWIGYVCGPPLIGQFAAATTLRVALAVIPLLTAVIAMIVWLSRVVRDET